MTRRRDPFLDMVRGLSLVIMTIDHLPLPFVQHFTFEPFGFFSAAHAFFFLSGWINGKQLGRVQAERGTGAAIGIAVQRTRKIFLYHVATVIVTCLCVLLVHEPSWRAEFPLFWRRPVLASAASIGMVHLPALFIVLPCYFCFFLVTPVVLKQLAAGRAWLIVAVSATLFLLAQWNVFTPPTDAGRIYNGTFNLAGWQAVFFGGFLLGNWRNQPNFRFSVSRGRIRATVVALVGLMLLRHLRNVFGAFSFLRTHSSADLRIPGWLTVLNFALFVVVCSVLPQGVRQGIVESRGGRALTFLGMHSLQVFVWHMGLWMCFAPFGQQLSASRAPAQVLAGAIATASLFIPAVIRAEYLSRRGREQQALRVAPA
jgi:hypothetical protein